MTTHLCIHGDVFTQTQAIVDWVASRTGWPVVTDQDLLEAAGRRLSMSASRIARHLKKTDGAPNRLSRATRQAMAGIQSAMVEKIGGTTTIFKTALALPTTRDLPQALNVLVTASPRARVKHACRHRSLTERQAHSRIQREDQRTFHWCASAFDGDRFDTEAYDLVVPSHRLDTESAGRLILEEMMRAEMHQVENAANRLEDLKMASEVWLRLSKDGHPVSANACNGHVRVTVERPVLFLNRLARQVEMRASQVKGVRQVQIDVGPDFFQTDIYRRCRFELPREAAFANYRQRHQLLCQSAAAAFPISHRPGRQAETVRATVSLVATASS